MNIKNESYRQLGETIKAKSHTIKELEDEIGTITEKLEETIDNKYRLNLTDSIFKLNQTAAIKIKIRTLEEEIQLCSSQRRFIKNNHLYKLQLSINSFTGKIEFFNTYKGKGLEKLFCYDGKELVQVAYLENIEESSWIKWGKKAIRKSTVKFFDKKYILHENGDFIVLPITSDDDYKAEDIIGNVFKYDKIPSGSLFS